MTAVETPDTRVTRGWRGSGWIVASAVALIAQSRWLSATSIEYLVLASTATAIAAALTLSLTRENRRWAAACVGALAVAAAMSATTQHRVAQLQRDWTAERARMTMNAVSALQRDVTSSVDGLRALARRALRVPADRGQAFHALARDTHAMADVAVTLYRGDSAFAWAGREYVGVDSLADSVGVAGSSFYLALYVVASTPTDRAVATRLLYALPPADRIATSLASTVARGTDVAGFRFAPPQDSATIPGATLIHIGGRAGSNGPALFAVAPTPYPQGPVQLRLLERARLIVGVLVAIALAAFLIGAWRLKRAWSWRAPLVLAGLACVAFAPLSAYSNSSRLFDPALYFTPIGGPLTANAAALALTTALILLLLLTTLRRQGRLPDRWLAVVIVVVVAGVGPFLLRDLARGIQIPSYGVSASLWFIWEVPLFLAAASVILAGAAAGSVIVGPTRGLPPAVAPVIASVAAVIAPILWQAPTGWPWWYAILWIVAIGSLAVSRRTNAVIVAAATVAALGAMTLVWGSTMRARVRLAQEDVAKLGTGDQYAAELADRLVTQITEAPATTRRALLQAYATSDLAAAGFPASLETWSTSDTPIASLSTTQIAVSDDALRALVVRARTSGQLVSAGVPAGPALAHAVAVPTDSGVTTVVAWPKSLLIPLDPFARLLGIETPPQAEPPYTIQAVPATTSTAAGGRRWRREGNEMHGDWVAPMGGGPARVHVEIELRSLQVLVQRGLLILLLDLAIVALLWLTSVVADGVAARWIGVRWRRYARSYRVRLTLALFAFFIVPALAFAVWSYEQLSADAARARELLVRETLRAARPANSEPWLSIESRRLETPLLLYEKGELAASSDSLLFEIAPTGRLLPAEVAQAILVQGEVAARRVERIDGGQALFGYRAFELHPGAGELAVLAAPARADDVALGRRARDLGVLVLFATAIGALAALWLSGAAARQLARPIGSLRQAALALASGDREPQLESEPTAEFLPVFAAFRRMVSDLNASRGALEEAQRRTATVLRNVASAVIAVDADATVIVANPRADELLGAPLPPRTSLAMVAPELADRVRAFLGGQDEEAEFEMMRDERQWRGRLTRLARSGGGVITLDDVSEIVRAERVLAWGEMARQVAHEIKNPLTPIRLGVQHLLRARADRRVDFEKVLEQNVERILMEIDHLDEIARAFSRYGQPPDQQGGAVPTDVAAILRDLVALETMGEEQTRWTLAGADGEVLALGRREELREVFLNVFENARLARATQVRIELGSDDGRVRVLVSDNGQGIPKDVLSRVFEPHFSTRTSGSGLGLAISRRVIESWGGSIDLESEEGHGTRVIIELLAEN